MAKIKDLFNTAKPENADVSLKDNDKALNAKIDLMISESDVISKDKLSTWKDNLDFFNGDQWKGKKQEFESDTVVNKIFPGIRSMVGLATDSRPKADVIAAPSSDPQQAEINQKKAQLIGYNFDQRWQDIGMQMKSTKSLFQAFIYDDAFWQPFWNNIENDVDVELVKPTEVRIDPTAYGDNAVDNARYVIFRPYKNKKWIEDNYPEKVKEVKFGANKSSTDIFGIKDDAEDENRGDLKDSVLIDDLWTDEIRIIRAGQVILWKGPNPYFEFRDENAQLADWIKEGNEENTFKPIRNYFKRPRKPLIMINTYNIGELYSRSMMKQLKPLQISLDKRKQQTDMNADLMANNQWVYDTSSMTEEQASQLTNEPGLQIGVEDINKIRKEPGAELPSFIARDMQHTEMSMDDVMGNHDISKGAKGQTMTATESNTLSEADQTPVRLLVRNFEFAVNDLYKWWMQYMALFYTEDHWIRSEGENGAKLFEQLNQNDISDGNNIVIVPGSTLPRDKSSIKAQASEALKMGMLDPLSYYEIMEFPDPHKSAIRLLNWQKGIISDKEEQPEPPQDDGPDERFISSMNYKDAPEDIRRQMEQLAGLQPSAQGGPSVTIAAQLDNKTQSQDSSQNHSVAMAAAKAKQDEQSAQDQIGAGQDNQLLSAAIDPENPTVQIPDDPNTPEDESKQPPQEQEQDTPDVAYAIQQEQAIAQGQEPEVQPEMITEAHVDHHVQTLEDPEYPNPEGLDQHTQQEIQFLMEQSGQGPEQPPQDPSQGQPVEEQLPPEMMPQEGGEQPQLPVMQ